MQAEERARRYIENLRSALAELEGMNLGQAARVIEQVRSYLADAEFYLERGDVITSIACSSYAEGLLDALNLLGITKIEWPRRLRPTVIVGGAFEILHPGHLHLLREARRFGRVVVIVARDSTIEKLKGRPPVVPEQQRLEVVRSIRYVDEAHLGNEPLDVEGTLLRFKPDVIVLGPDQNHLEKLVKEAISRLNLNTQVVKLKNRVGNSNFSSSIIAKRLLELA